MRMPKLAIAAVLLALVALASATTYAGFLLVSTVALYLNVSRFVAGLLLGILFARLPWVREGKLRAVGLLPGKARLPVMASLLAFCLLHFLYRGDMVPVLFLGFAVSFLLGYRRLRQLLLARAVSSFFQPAPGPARPQDDKSVIDVEFREKKD
jgi:hypothetical protein